MSDRLKSLADAGVSIWLDDLSRERIESGNLAEVVETKSVVGVTTNPTIFAGAIANGERYDAQVRELVADGQPVDRVVFELTTEDVRNACDVLAPVADATAYDGRVSIEVEPTLANDTEGTIASAQALWKAVDRSNALIKIPATKEGLPAITAVIAQGISVNVTLIFGDVRYREVMDAYLSGLEQARDAGLDLATINSVASFFISRVDTEVDARLDKIGTDEALALQGQGRRRQRPDRLRRLRGGARLRPLEAARRGRRQPAAPAVGLHRGQEPRLPRHPLRHRPRRRRHRQHHAGEDDGRLRRPRRGRRRPGHRPRPTRPRPSSPSSRPSGSTSRTCSVHRARGRRQVQEVVDRAHRDRREADGAGQGMLTARPPVDPTSTPAWSRLTDPRRGLRARPAGLVRRRPGPGRPAHLHRG